MSLSVRFGVKIFFVKCITVVNSNSKVRQKKQKFLTSHVIKKKRNKKEINTLLSDFQQ